MIACSPSPRPSLDAWLRFARGLLPLNEILAHTRRRDTTTVVTRNVKASGPVCVR